MKEHNKKYIQPKKKNKKYWESETISKTQKMHASKCKKSNQVLKANKYLFFSNLTTYPSLLPVFKLITSS